MNENVKKWVAALESGEFQQVKGFLRAGDQYCCLGVACELYRREVGGVHWRDIGGEHLGVKELCLDFGGSASSWLPTQVREWLELRTTNGHFARPEETPNSLASLNDKGATFKEIAAVIRSEPAGLFVTT